MAFSPPSPAGRRRAFAVDFLLLLLLAAVLVKPLFKAKYLQRWGSIESTFIADSRFLKQHWPHPGWQPLWYCGTRFDYVYPPALRYATALLAGIWLPVKAYHVYTALMFSLGIAAVYAFVRLAGRGRGPAWLAAAGTALLSPSFLFLRDVRLDSGFLVPQRLGVLVRYGEGPHICALALLPLALGFAFRGLRRGGLRALALAALFSALVVSHNFYGATALAFLFPILAWSVWVAEQDRRVWLRAAAIAALAYGLTALWLVPSYVRITLANMRYVSQTPHAWSIAVAAAALAAFAAMSLRLARGKRERAYPVFLCGAVLLFSLHVIGFYLADLRLAGEPRRLVPELDLLLILGAVELLAVLWRHGRAAVRVGVAALVAASFATATPFVRKAWTLYPREFDYHRRVEYRLADWVARNLPGQRVFATGSVRFWLDAWQDLPQVDGGSLQGLANGAIPHAQWSVAVETEQAVEWLRALGARAVIVHDERSQEIFHDIQHPHKFAPLLPVLYDTHEGDVIYGVPQRFAGLARVVNRADFAALERAPDPPDLAWVRRYTAAADNAGAEAVWQGTDALRVRARAGAGQSVLVQETYDPAWRAWSGGQRLAIRRAPITGFMLLDAPPGDHDIRLVFETPLENIVGRVLSACSVLVFGALIAAAHKRE